MLIVLSKCDNNDPEATLKNYFSSLQDMEFEEFYEFMSPNLRDHLGGMTGENLDEDVPDEVESLKSYKEYTSELAKLYKKIDYEVIDNPPDDENTFREYPVRVTVPNIDEITEKAAMNSIGSLFGALFTGEVDSEAYDDMFTGLVEDMKSAEIEEETIEGIITIELSENDVDSNEEAWLISDMDEDIFGALTP